MIDGHVHMMGKARMDDLTREGFISRMKEADCRGSVVFSVPPRTFSTEYDFTSEEKLAGVMELSEKAPGVIPFYFVDPLERDAVEQVDLAVKAGIAGFKIMCIDAPPGEPKAMEVYRRIAHHGKPVLFHSGILWNGKPSSEFNRPALFEQLMNVDGLRFALAHVSWPWYDECMAVFGKFQQQGRNQNGGGMYIDLTPGTPEIYRTEVLTKLFTIGYEVEDRVLFGSDCFAEDYDVEWVRKWRETDRRIYDGLGLPAEQVDRLEEKNLLRFLGGENTDFQRI